MIQLKVLALIALAGVVVSSHSIRPLDDFRRHGGNDHFEIFRFCDSLTMKETGTAGVLRRRNHRFVPTPPLLADVTSEAAVEFCNIVQNSSLTKGEVKQLIAEWVEGQSEQTQELFANITEWRETVMEEIRSRIENISSSLSLEARTLLSELEAIIDNDDISRFEERLQLIEAFSNVDSTVKKELKKAMKKLEKSFKRRPFSFSSGFEDLFSNGPAGFVDGPAIGARFAQIGPAMKQMKMQMLNKAFFG